MRRSDEWRDRAAPYQNGILTGMNRPFAFWYASSIYYGEAPMDMYEGTVPYQEIQRRRARQKRRRQAQKRNRRH